MPRVIPAVQPLTSAGITDTLTAPTVDNDEFVNNGRRFLRVNNGSGGSINVTVSFGQTVDGQAIASKVHAIGAGASKMIGPFSPNYNQPSGKVFVDYSAVASVTRGLFELNPV